MREKSDLAAYSILQDGMIYNAPDPCTSNAMIIAQSTCTQSLNSRSSPSFAIPKLPPPHHQRPHLVLAAPSRISSAAVEVGEEVAFLVYTWCI